MANESDVPSEDSVSGSEEIEQRTAEAVRDVLNSADSDSETTVRDRVRLLVIELLQGRIGNSESIRTVVNGVIEAGADIIRKSAPPDPENAMKSVIDGVATGVESVAQAAGYAWQEAKGRGERFAKEDLDRVTKDLDSITRLFSETVSHATRRLAEESGIAAQELKTHAQRAVDAVQPVISGTLDAIRRDPIQTAADTTNSTIRGGRLLAGTFLEAVSGALAGAAEILKPGQGDQR
jgi:hypothetical protein